MNERLKRLRFRAGHRGMKELDVILGRFAQVHLDGMDERQLDQFEGLLAVPDPDLHAWLTGTLQADREHDHEVLRRLRAFSLTPQDYSEID